jgi:hypothetical protein
VVQARGLLGGRTGDRGREPVDLDTGIQDASDHAYEQTSALKSPDQPIPLPPDPAAR